MATGPRITPNASWTGSPGRILYAAARTAAASSQLMEAATAPAERPSQAPVAASSFQSPLPISTPSCRPAAVPIAPRPMSAATPAQASANAPGHTPAATAATPPTVSGIVIAPGKRQHQPTEALGAGKRG